MIPIIPIPGFSEPFSSISHLVGAISFFMASFFMIFRGRGNNARVIGLLIYCFCLVFLFTMSGVYHLLEKGFTANYVLKILDYTGIFGLIAGTFTPLHLILFRGVHRWPVLIIVWTLAITGLVLTAIFFEEIPHWVSLSIFLFLGWIGLYTMWRIYHVHSKKLVRYIILGGVFYTIGAVIEFLSWPELLPGIVGPHEIFHIFVILAAIFHWKLVYKISKYPISSKITIIVREFPDCHYRAEATSEHAYFYANSLEEVKEKVMGWVDDKFHHDMKPTMINFKYFKEEDIYL